MNKLFSSTKSTRTLTRHDGSKKCPTNGSDYGIIAIDANGIEHHSSYSDFPHETWAWEIIIWWRYDDATLLEIQTNRMNLLLDSIRENNLNGL